MAPLRGQLELGHQSAHATLGRYYDVEIELEQRCRDAKIVQIFGETDKTQVAHVATCLFETREAVRP